MLDMCVWLSLAIELRVETIKMFIIYHKKTHSIVSHTNLYGPLTFLLSFGSSLLSRVTSEPENYSLQQNTKTTLSLKHTTVN